LGSLSIVALDNGEDFCIVRIINQNNNTMKKFSVPTRDQVSPENRNLFDAIKEKVGFVPNIYATYAISDHALGRYLNFANGKTSLSNREKEAVNLIVSQVNGCKYCLAAHTAIAKMNGFTDDQILEIREGEVSFEAKLHALVKTARSIVENRGQADEEILENYFSKGYSQSDLVDLILAVGEKTITNYLHKITDIPIDFPPAPELQTAEVRR
jgi:uncharacterized peroxidase-related enzyme